MSLETCFLDLKPERSLLNPSFEGYKLSLDPIAIYRKSIEPGVHIRQPTDEQFSFSHVKIFSLHNHLHRNPYGDAFPYFVDKNNEIFKIWVSPQNQMHLIKVGYRISEDVSSGPPYYNVSLAFPAKDFAVVSNGSGSVSLAKIKEGADEGAEVWEMSASLCKGERPFVLLDACFVVNENNKELHLLSCFVEEKNLEEKEKVKTGLFQTVLLWMTFNENESFVWEKSQERQLSVDGSIDYAVLEPGCQSIYVIGDRLPQWISDSLRPVEAFLVKNSIVSKVEKVYFWHQNCKDITVDMSLPAETKKSDLEVLIDDLKMEIKLKGETILMGNFSHKIDKELTLWVFEKNKLEIQLTKIEENTWKTLLVNDDKGEEILDPDMVKNVHEKLAHLCSEQEEGGQGVVFNGQQLEECDVASCDNTYLVRISGINHCITHQISLSSLQWLFKVYCEKGQSPAICCRHDVDACVWQFKKVEDDGKIWPHQHIGTFSAFGYVQASKSQKKFLASPPNLSYVCVCDSSHHLYIYHQPSPISTELKNRNTGKKVNMISKQQLVNLESRGHILGLYATNNLLYVLLESSICVLAINV